MNGSQCPKSDAAMACSGHAASKLLPSFHRHRAARSATTVGGTMKTNSLQFIYQAINAIATGKYCAEIEEMLSDAIEQKLLAINEQAQAA